MRRWRSALRKDSARAKKSRACHPESVWLFQYHVALAGRANRPTCHPERSEGSPQLPLVECPTNNRRDPSLRSGWHIASFLEPSRSLSTRQAAEPLGLANGPWMTPVPICGY